MNNSAIDLDENDSDPAFFADTDESFLEDMSREVSSVLTSMLSLTEQLRESPSEVNRLVPQIQGRGERLRSTLRSVKHLARLSEGQVELGPETIDAVEVAQGLLEDCKQSVHAQGLVLTLEAPDPPVEMTTDEAVLRRALRPLLTNAIAFTHEGEVSVHIEAKDAEVEFHVEDTGVGVPSDVLPSLFEPFAQRAPEEEDASEGLGLGLSLARGFAAHLEATIEAESDPGEGSVFTLRAARHLSEADAPAADEMEGAAPRLLIVEDNDVTQKLFRRMLEEDYRIETAMAAGEAIKMAEENVYDVFVLDVNLSGRRTGVEVLNAVRKMETYSSVPAVACTAYALDEHRKQFLQAGFDDVVAKPVTKREILEVIEHQLDAPDSSESNELEVSLSGIELPPIPTTLVKVAALTSSDPDSSDVETLTEVLQKDQVVSQWLIGHINSAYYSLSESINTIERAVRYLGFRPVSNLVLTKIIGESFSGTGDPESKRVQKYIMETSALAGFIAREVADQFGLDAPEVAYTAGMFAQIGRLAFLEAESETYVDLWFEGQDRSGSFEGPPPRGQEILRYEKDYVQNGLAVGKTCGLSDEMYAVLRGHRRATQVDEEFQPLVPIVALALKVAHLAGSLEEETPWSNAEALVDEIREFKVARHLAEQESVSLKTLASRIVDVAEEAGEFVEQV
ncbi:MAG: HDOD domain-containing protein [Salinibacter sp.]